jgi:hypothetical protein
MINAGKQAVTGAQNMADKADPYIEKAQKFMPHKKGGKVQNAESLSSPKTHAQKFAKAVQAVEKIKKEKSQHKKSGGSIDGWMQEASKNSKRGALHKALKIPMDKKIPTELLEKKAHSSNKLMKKRANLALRYRGD